jgi:CheY-like chemotaxis protein/tetratricopeptide (TPR) repeat protein
MKTRNTFLVIGEESLQRELDALFSGRFESFRVSDEVDGVVVALMIRPMAVLVDADSPHFDGTKLYRAITRHRGLQYSSMLLVSKEARAREEIKKLPTFKGSLRRPLDPFEILVRLPTFKWENPAEETVKKEAELPKTEVKNTKILVIDDSFVARKLYSMILMGEGFKVTTAIDGMDGMNKIKEIIPDLILLDFVMPHMNGFQVARTLQKDPKLKHIPIILSSANVDRFGDKFVKQGLVTDYINVPVQPEDLISKVYRILEAHNVEPTSQGEERVRAMAVNPYTIGIPLGGETGFYGREDIWKEVQKLSNNPRLNTLVLYGQRRIGKTSLLLQLQRWLREGTTCLPLYFDLQDKTEKSLPDVLYELAQYIGDAVDIPIPEKEQFDPKGGYFRKQFLPDVTKAIGKPLVLLFDEWDVVDSLDEKRAGQTLLPYLSRLVGEFRTIKFIFAMGRNLEDLSLQFRSLFKEAKSIPVSILSFSQAEELIFSSQENASLVWTPEALQKVWDWAQGHPYFIQLLCGTVWDQIYQESHDEMPIANPEQVDAVIPIALERGASTLEWIWNGLPPVEKAVMSILSARYDRDLSFNEIEKSLLDVGLRTVAENLGDTLKRLCDWDIIIKSREGYHVFVPLLGKWLAEHIPLSQLKDELDRINPRADKFYQRGRDHYHQEDKREEAKNFLEWALLVNPNHLKARLLLGQIYLDQQQPKKAIEILESAYQYDEKTSQSYLIQALMAEAEQSKNLQAKFELYQRILKIRPDHLEAKKWMQHFWEYTGDKAKEAGKLEQALKAYQRAMHKEKILEVKELIRKQKLQQIDQQVTSYKKSGEWDRVILFYQKLLEKFPEETNWQKELETARKQYEYKLIYLKALRAFEEEDYKEARELLIKIISQQLDYEKAVEYLIEIKRKLNPNLVSRPDERDIKIRSLEEKIRSLQTKYSQVLSERDTKIRSLEEKLRLLQP